MTGEQHLVIAGPARAALARLLAAAPPSRLTAVAGDMFAFEHFSEHLSWRDTAAVVDRIAAMPVSVGGVPPLLAFAARVAAELTGRLGAEIDLWVDAVADAIGIDRTIARANVRQSATEAEDLSNNESQRTLSTEESGAAAVTGQSASTTTEPPNAREARREARIWSGVPVRNPTFIGRETLLLALHRALGRRSKASVLPRAPHGMGGVGKTQLAAEFAYRYADRYDVVWWIPAEQQSMVLQSLRQLGRHLGIPETADLQHAARLVLEELAGSPLRWLLIYDNANEPEDIARLLPARGGDIILTSRNQTWSDVWDPVQVDVFDRAESIELVQRRREGVSAADADRLAARLADLPLALDQAVSCQIATGMSVGDYLAELEEHARELAADGSPRATLVAVVRLAIRQLRARAPAVAELLELFAFLGPEPISGGLLRRGREADVSPALGRALREQIAWDRSIRDLRRYGLAKVDPDQRIQMHRLFQSVLRDELLEDAARRGRGNVQRLLASANPGYPLDEAAWPIHAEIGPHIGPAGLIDSELLDARRVVLDQIRYLNVIGDLEGCRRLGDAVVDAWSKVEGVNGLGPNGEMTLRASLYLSITLRHLGFNERARSLSESALERFRANPDFGPDHEYTLYAASVLAPNLRVAGQFHEALAFDEDNVARHREVFGDEDEETVNARSNLAVNLRLLSDFAGAHAIDTEAVRIWQQVVGENDIRLLFARTNLARDLYGLGRYAEALELLRSILPPFRRQLGAQHPYVLLADRTFAIALRKVGRYDEAVAVAAEHERDSARRYGPQHERTLAAAMTHANTLRVIGDLSEAYRRAAEAMDRYLLVFGEGHPLTLAAAVNHAIALRGVGEHARARELDERTYARMNEVLGPEHGDTLCAASNLGNDLAMAGEVEAAWRMSTATLRISQRARGQPHPYTLACAVNAAIDTIAIGARDEGRASLDGAVTALVQVLGASHPETVAAREGRRAESDIEPPPT